MPKNRFESCPNHKTKIMKRFDQFLKFVDSLAPDPWIVGGSVQARPIYQLGFMLGVAVTSIVIYLFF